MAQRVTRALLRQRLDAYQNAPGLARRTAEGSIEIKNTGALHPILEQAPPDIDLLQIYDGRSASGHCTPDEVRFYAKAADLFFSRGLIFRGWLCKLMEWRIQGAPGEHLAKAEQTIRNASPRRGIDAFVKHLSRDERLAVFSKFRLISLPAGRTVISAKEHRHDLHIVVSGMLEEGGAGQRPHLSPPPALKEGDFFGFGELAAQPPGDHPDIVSITRVELVKISADHLLSTFRSHPNALKKFRLFSHATGNRRPVGPETARKGARYPAQTVMVLRISPLQDHEIPLVLTGVLHEVSVGGLCFVPESNHVLDMSSELTKNAQAFVGRRGIVKILAEGISLQVPGQVARTGHVVIDGRERPCFGISLEGLSSMARWVFFTFVTLASGNPPLPERRFPVSN